jgi:hypothetical protein
MKILLISLIFCHVLPTCAQEAPEKLPTFGDVINVLGAVSICLGPVRAEDLTSHRWRGQTRISRMALL